MILARILPENIRFKEAVQQLKANGFRWNGLHWWKAGEEEEIKRLYQENPAAGVIYSFSNVDTPT